MKDTDHEVYYEKPRKSCSNNNHKYDHHQRKKLQKRLNQPCCNTTALFLEGNIQQNDFKYNTREITCCNCRINSEVNTCCSLQSPCYFCTRNNDREINQFRDPRINQKSGLRYSGKLSSFQCCSNGGHLNRNMGRRSYDNGASVYEVFNSTEMQKEKSTGSQNSQTRNETAIPPYLRAMTMPQERPKEVEKYRILRSNSMPFQNPNNVHPKLPEYDEIAAKFRALKKEHLLHKTS